MKEVREKIMLIHEATSLEEIVILQRLNQSNDRDPVKSLFQVLASTKLW